MPLFSSPHKSPQQQAREVLEDRERQAIRQEAQDFIDELRRDLAAFQRAANEDRLGYPLVMRRRVRRPTDD